MNFLNKIIVIIITICLLVLIYFNQSYIFHQIVSKPKIYFWMKRDGNAESIKEFKKNLKEFKSIESHFDSFADNTLHEYTIPIFDKSIYIKKYLPNQFDTQLFGKEDSLPYIINMFTTPRNLFGKWKGDSIFRIDLDKRGKNNQYKENYMKALKSTDLESYRALIKNYFKKHFTKNLEIDYFDFIHEQNINLTYLIHFNQYPSPADIEDVLLFINTVRTYSFKQTYLDKQLYNLQQFYRKTLKLIGDSKGKTCLVGKWLEYGDFTQNQIFVEFIHNILGMAINWTNLMYKYILEYDAGKITPIPKNNIKPYLYETIRYLNPVRFTSSKIKKPELFDLERGSSCMALHDLKLPTRMPQFFGKNPNKFNANRLMNYKKDTIKLEGKCPFSGFFESPKGAKVVCGMELFEKEGYIGFGEGYRRCPGEHLSLVYLEEMAKFIKQLNFEIYLKNGINKKISYIWGEVDKNLVLKIG